MKLFEIKNQPPRWEYLTESADKALHIEHLEDEIFNKGYIGAVEISDYFKGLHAMLTENGTGETTKVTVKWDGSPAIHCGIDPEDGKFFIGTKSVFSKNAKLCKKDSDIDTWYGTQGDLAHVLKMCLKHLPKLGITGVIKGDLMFCAGSDHQLVPTTIDGVDYISFTPNTLTYSVPSDSKIAKEMQKAQIGIVFHTVYNWEPPTKEEQEYRIQNGLEPRSDTANLPDMKAHYRFSSNSIKKHPDVWWDDAYYEDLTGIATLTPLESSKILNELARFDTTVKKINQSKFNAMLVSEKSSDFVSMIKPFINLRIKSGTTQVESTTEFLNDFISYVKDKLNKEISKLKTGPQSPAAQKRIDRIENLEQFIADNSNTLLGILAIYKKTIELKLFFLKKLQMIESVVGTFIKTESGYRVSKPEGFIAVSSSGSVVKLIDRLEFSRDNFNKS